jgi:sugar transferase EpsL
MSDLSLVIKRILDLAGAILGLAVFGLPMAIVAGLIRLRMGSPVLYRVIRPGLHAETFHMYKFRTMRDLVDAAGRPLSDKERITPLGRFLRKTSLDELPQLVNVLDGDMSIVGPRPLKVEYLKLYTPNQARRHEVKPGITGLAQIKGRNTLSWDERFALDVWYVDHASLVLDLRILMHTVVNVLRRDSVSPDGDLDIPSFTGSLSANHAQRGLRDVTSGPS